MKRKKPRPPEKPRAKALNAALMARSRSAAGKHTPASKKRSAGRLRKEAQAQLNDGLVQ